MATLSRAVTSSIWIWLLLSMVSPTPPIPLCHIRPTPKAAGVIPAIARQSRFGPKYLLVLSFDLGWRKYSSNWPVPGPGWWWRSIRYGCRLHPALWRNGLGDPYRIPSSNFHHGRCPCRRVGDWNSVQVRNATLQTTYHTRSSISFILVPLFPFISRLLHFIRIVHITINVCLVTLKRWIENPEKKLTFLQFRNNGRPTATNCKRDVKTGTGPGARHWGHSRREERALFSY